MWHNKNINEIYNELKTSEKGLSNNEVINRLNTNGRNELPKKEENSILKILLSELSNPILLLLIFTIIVSIFLKEYTDAVVIVFIVVVDLILGTYQEYKAEKTIEALANLVNLESRVIRNGKEIVVDSKDLVVGDIILLESGDKISADTRIIEAHNLLIDESTLTGESIGVEKTNDIISLNAILSERKNILYAGTSVLRGRAVGVVVETGENTEIGKIASDVNNAKDTKSPLTLRVEKFSKQICAITLSIAVIITIILFIKGYEGAAIFSAVIALSVSAMPEGLPLALTMALTVSSNRMQKKNVIVKKLNSVESLGSCTVIASDKTGTLTVNEQTAKVIMLPNKSASKVGGTGYNSDGAIEYKNNEPEIKEIAFLGMINNEANIIGEPFGDSIDIAFKYLAKKADVNEFGTQVLDTIPYESENKFSSVFYKINNEVHCTVKGSIEKILSFSKYMNIDGKKEMINIDLLQEQNELLAENGYRVIAIADGVIEKKEKYTIDDINNLEFKGLVGFVDPIRVEAKDAIEKCTTAGIKVIMITGDHPKTAYNIASELNLASSYDEVITKEEFDTYVDKSELEFDEMIKSKKVFARVTPSDKLKIVESCKRNGEFIAVTGDGVNDAPAIKAANIGISMGSGTDVAKETASMIIIDDNFASIVNGIEEGRVAYSNIRKVVYMLISSGFAEIFFFLISIILDLPMPLVAIQILWLNVVTDGLQDLALSFERTEKGTMEERPRSPKEALFDKTLFREIFISGLAMGLMVIGLWYYLIKFTDVSIDLARGYTMTLMVFLQNFQVFNCCSEKQTIFKHNFKSNMFVVFTVVSAVVLQILVSEVPVLSAFFKIDSVPVVHLILLMLYAGIILVIMEVYKLIQRKK